MHWWTDIGLDSFGLSNLRDKAEREVDFLVEAKSTDRDFFEARRPAIIPASTLLLQLV